MTIRIMSFAQRSTKCPIFGWIGSMSGLSIRRIAWRRKLPRFSSDIQ